MQQKQEPYHFPTAQLAQGDTMREAESGINQLYIATAMKEEESGISRNYIATIPTENIRGRLRTLGDVLCNAPRSDSRKAIESEIALWERELARRTPASCGDIVRTKFFFGKRADGTLVVLGCDNRSHSYQGDYYANEFFDMPERYNPLGLTLAQLLEQLAVLNRELRTEQKARADMASRTLATDLAEDR